METLYLDTHIVIWLREKALDKLSQKAVDCIENADLIMVSAMVVLELKYLYEIGRIYEEPQRI
ncbi:MAG: PIN domain nuclease, partial [Campylobacterota bacterium]|nr:PIN domain nuclease [Campylobacterota bacterium]